MLFFDFLRMYQEMGEKCADALIDNGFLLLSGLRPATSDKTMWESGLQV